MIDSLLEITRDASAIILEIYNRSEEFQIDQKEDRTPVTEADLAAHHLIVERLHDLAPDIPIISEESGVPPIEERAVWNRFFLVDPLDGTKEFISRNGEFTVNIALIEGGAPVVGVVGVPVLNTIYMGCGQANYGVVGSFRMVGPEDPERIISSRFTPPGVADVVVSRSHGDMRTEAFLNKLGIQTGKCIASGSSLKFCRVAEGVADLYPRMGPTMEWDTAAGDAVWRWSVGGAVSNNFNNVKDSQSVAPPVPRWSPLRYNKPSLKNGTFILGLEEREHPVQISF